MIYCSGDGGGSVPSQDTRHAALELAATGTMPVGVSKAYMAVASVMNPDDGRTIHNVGALVNAYMEYIKGFKGGASLMSGDISKYDLHLLRKKEG